VDDPRAADFDAFYLRSRDRLAMQVAALTGDPAEALDHVQEAYVRAWSRWGYVAALDDPESWVRRVAHNIAISRWRHARRLVLHATAAERALEIDDDQQDVIAALRTLPVRHREAIVLHHLVGLSVDEVAGYLDAPSGTVKSWLSRGRLQLAAVLSEPSTEEIQT
jgi:RNA polymerase sigma-70 factor (ECF subfamily)